MGTKTAIVSKITSQKLLKQKGIVIFLRYSIQKIKISQEKLKIFYLNRVLFYLGLNRINHLLMPINKNSKEDLIKLT